MRRGEVWWANLPVPAGRRPVVLLSRDESYTVRSMVTVAPVTTRIRGLHSEVSLGREDGLPSACVANLDTIQTVAKARLETRIASLSSTKVQEIEEAIHFALALER